jgi:malectin (di-glucose binding ER protein)/glycosyl hydrolase family 16
MVGVERGAVKLAIGILAMLLAGGVVVLLLSGGGTGESTQMRAPLAPVAEVQAVESSAALRDASGGVWTPDRFAHGGSLLTSSVPIADTSSPALYRRQRVGIASIDVPLRSEGSYLVVLYFAETAGAVAGERTFDVLAQGRRIATVDVARDVGALTPYHLAFTVPVFGHRLTLRFIAHRGEPILSALRVTRVNSSIELPAHQLVWTDDFNGPRGARPDPTHWSYDLGTGWGQAAVYTSQAANAALDGRGNLVLAERREGPHLTSARLTTQGLYTMRYGAASARLRVAGEPGVVSTFWALGTNVNSVGWPRSGEIDPLEVRGVQPRVLIEALHMSCPGRPCSFVWNHALAASLGDGFHTVTVERAPGVVIYLLDGRQTASLTRADVPPGAWVFDKPFFLILNLIGGGWGGKTTAATHWPLEMSVDWVRVLR